MSKRLVVAGAILFLFICLGQASVSAERPSEGIGKWLQEVGVFTGYIKADLKNQKDMEAVPMGFRFGFDLKPFTKKFGLDPKGLLELVYEPFLSVITEPDLNAEFGLPFFFKYAYPITEKLYPFIEVGTGPYYMTLHTREQSTQFNFVNQGGAGLIYFLKDDLALNVGYRFRHVSNGSIKEPNNGIDANVFLAGVSYYF